MDIKRNRGTRLRLADQMPGRNGTFEKNLLGLSFHFRNVKLTIFGAIEKFDSTWPFQLKLKVWRLYRFLYIFAFYYMFLVWRENYKKISFPFRRDIQMNLIQWERKLSKCAIFKYFAHHYKFKIHCRLHSIVIDSCIVVNLHTFFSRCKKKSIENRLMTIENKNLSMNSNFVCSLRAYMNMSSIMNVLCMVFVSRLVFSCLPENIISIFSLSCVCVYIYIMFCLCVCIGFSSLQFLLLIEFINVVIFLSFIFIVIIIMYFLFSLLFLFFFSSFLWFLLLLLSIV